HRRVARQERRVQARRRSAARQGLRLQDVQKARAVPRHQGRDIARREIAARPTRHSSDPVRRTATSLGAPRRVIPCAGCRVSRMNPQTSEAPRLAPLGDEARRLCQALLRMDTTNPPGNEKICADYLAAELAEVGYQPELLELAPGRTNLV